jgi:ParB-like chromosome segregation protein Spo0J
MEISNTPGSPSRQITDEQISPSALKPYVNNARVHPRSQIDKLKKNIAKFGFLNPILADEVYEVIAGHCRLIAATELGLDLVRVVRIAGLTEIEKRALRLADNQIALESIWDIDLVRSELRLSTLPPASEAAATSWWRGCARNS